MKHRQQPSDEEIQSYMNFDRLLDSRKTALKASKVSALIKWGVPVLMLTGIIVWFSFLRDTDRPIVKQKAQPDTSVTAINITPPIPVDSGTKETVFEDKISGKIPAHDIQTEVEQPAHTAEKSEVKQKEETEMKEAGYFQAEPLTGYPDLYEYFNANLIYPVEALKDSIQGVQTVSFIINAKGQPEQIEVVKSLGEPFEKEAKRLIENMPEWKPATLNGKAVASKISLPLTFQIQKIKK